MTSSYIPQITSLLNEIALLLSHPTNFNEVVSFKITDNYFKMKNDARILINKKKWRKQTSTSIGRSDYASSRSGIDARKIINLKRSRVTPRKQYIRELRTSHSSVIPIIKKTFAPNKEPNKKVKLSSDGNIWITAQSKGSSMAPGSLQRNKILPSSSATKQIQWIPADVNMDNVEHIAVNDVLDMESLPSATVSSNVRPRNQATYVSRRTLAEKVLDMQNTMVADQVANASANQSGQVLVTNLGPSVSKQDIMELFGDVGVIKNAAMPQIGTAVIEFYDVNDAAQACEIYHNRLLDGQPMKCYIQSNAYSHRVSVSERYIFYVSDYLNVF
ncbi:RRM domain-containing protein [Trichonephila clavata]|uniref:RRM domain-containing protein n=1 Tax=Trichonephila clavata TaxID=2740835 RepID=A0A8X6KEL1_TRICU|nr:RRM domain-containing protein [Trichonephila clavata]